MPIPKDTKKVTHKDYQTRQWPMLQPFPARTEKLGRHIVLEKGFRKIQKNNLRFQYTFQKVFKNLFIQNLPHGILFIPFRKSVQNSQQLSQTISINIVLALIHGCNKMLKEICALDNSNGFQNSIMHILIFLFPHPELFVILFRRQ